LWYWPIILGRLARCGKDPRPQLGLLSGMSRIQPSPAARKRCFKWLMVGADVPSRSLMELYDSPSASVRISLGAKDIPSRQRPGQGDPAELSRARACICDESLLHYISNR